MGWVDESGEHEMWIAPMFPDGATGGSHGHQGINVGGWGPGEEDWRHPKDIVGWEVRCHCYRGQSRNPTTTVLARWTRVRPPETEEDPAAGRFIVDDDGDAEFVGDSRPDIEELALSLWRVHYGPHDATRAIEAAAEAQRKAAAQLDAAVAAGHAAGLSWADVGRAVGITRQSARERWG